MVVVDLYSILVFCKSDDYEFVLRDECRVMSIIYCICVLFRYDSLSIICVFVLNLNCFYFLLFSYINICRLFIIVVILVYILVFLNIVF